MGPFENMNQMQLLQMLLGNPTQAAGLMSDIAPPPPLPTGAPGLGTPLGGIGSLVAPQTAPPPVPRPITQEFQNAAGLDVARTAQGEGIGEGQGEEDPINEFAKSLRGVQAPPEKRPPQPSTAAPGRGGSLSPQGIQLLMQMLMGGQPGAPSPTLASLIQPAR